MLSFVNWICSQFTDPYILKSVYCAHVQLHLEYWVQGLGTSSSTLERRCLFCRHIATILRNIPASFLELEHNWKWINQEFLLLTTLEITFNYRVSVKFDDSWFLTPQYRFFWATHSKELIAYTKRFQFD